ncbi:hypothetical protein [Vibrio parahaemolyticus]|uniref:hypothetical protein n=1 Tax=Vibrio parahaemolyticus TaxID=670 RepID=UPI001B835FBD|nr:hypothetical protein [Vibrio parahaemolyticus]MCR9819765.1 hypothetical protein [Vibrio parahaemolyticus]MDF5667546.1 hypothetical protein [Vibrio parahaemolyticus]HBC3544432.1 hypothetical protein [Vibrio parahaemolyticus]
MKYSQQDFVNDVLSMYDYASDEHKQAAFTECMTKINTSAGTCEIHSIAKKETLRQG